MINLKEFVLILSMLLLLASPALASQSLDYKVLHEGSAWNIGGGYYIIMLGVDYEGKQAYVSLLKEGEVQYEELIQQGEIFKYKDSADTLIVSMELNSIFKGLDADTCRFINIYLRYGEKRETPSPTSTHVETVKETSIKTALPRSTVNVDYGAGAMIPGLSPLTVTLLLMLAIIVRKHREK